MEQGKTKNRLQRDIFKTHLILILVLALFLSAAGTLFSLRTETKKRDANLQNIAESVAHSELVRSGGDPQALKQYLDALKSSLSDVDIISVVDSDSHRIYHSNHGLIGTIYDGTMPNFSDRSGVYAENSRGPSGVQRRTYAAIYDAEGEYRGFVIAVMLQKTIRIETLRILTAFAVAALLAIGIELLLSARLSKRIKDGLLGFEPDTFSAMFRTRDEILESLEEGVIAVGKDGKSAFCNRAAADMLHTAQTGERGERLLWATLQSGKREHGVQVHDLPETDVLIDRVPIVEDGEIKGAVGILHDRREYTRLMEDLTGTRYLVDSMRANNHDFTNKLHVILGLIQMELYDEASEYIENITILQKEKISSIMGAVDEPALAALLIGKVSRAGECNVKFELREGSHYSRGDVVLPADALVTIVGNLIDNALEAMNLAAEGEKLLLFGMFSKPGALLITVDDSGVGMDEETQKHIFENGYSTKGESRGTGLFQTKSIVENYGGHISVESQKGIGSSFAVSFYPGEKGAE